MHSFVRIGVLLALAVSPLGCSGSDGQRQEFEALAAQNEALEAEVREYRTTVERLEAEVKSLNSENGKLESELATLQMELEEARDQTPIEFVERVVERPALRPRQSETIGSENLTGDPSGLQVVEASARATERNSSWWRFGWVVSVRNHSASLQTFKLRVQFMDKDGYVLDEDVEYGLTIPAGSVKTFRESDLLDVSIAPRVTSVNPVIDP